MTLDALKILSLGRNNIKKIEGLEAVANTLQELWVSYNMIERLNGVELCKNLKVLYASNNRIKAWDGIQVISTMPTLEDILLAGNPLEEKFTAEGTWVAEMTKRYTQLKRLDGRPIVREDAVDEES